MIFFWNSFENSFRVLKIFIQFLLGIFRESFGYSPRDSPVTFSGDSFDNASENCFWNFFDDSFVNSSGDSFDKSYCGSLREFLRFPRDFSGVYFRNFAPGIPARIIQKIILNFLLRIFRQYLLGFLLEVLGVTNFLFDYSRGSCCCCSFT